MTVSVWLSMTAVPFVGDLPSPDLAEAYDDLVLEDSWDMIKRRGIKTIYPGHGDAYAV